VTYLFEGAMMHRDSIGSSQLIEPGAITWMTAGRGIVHSERRPESLRSSTYTNHGLQLWVALPREHEEAEPSFEHTPAAAIPEGRVDDATVRVLVGEAFGLRSPVHTLMPTLYLDVQLPAGGRLRLPALAPEMAVYVVQGSLTLDGQPLAAQQMAVLGPEGAELLASEATRLVVIGGAPLDAPRHMWWNFVSARRERIAQAADDWEAQRMGQVPGETEFIPLPERRFLA
ncbi:MAG: pirin family protein, partial [Hylemonella sp.]